MAPFKFGRKLHQVEKSLNASPKKGADPTLPSNNNSNNFNNASPSQFNNASPNNFKADQFQQQQQRYQNQQMYSPNIYPQQHQQQMFSNYQYQQHNPQQYSFQQVVDSNQPQNPRLYPTPPPSQQRNVSGAATTLAPQLKEYTPWNRIKLQNSPFPRYRHVASGSESKDNNIYVVGGLHDQSVYGDTWIITSQNDCKQFTSKSIEIGENTPPPRVGHAATLCGNAYVIFGGDTHKVNKEGLMDDDLYLFNINSFKWTIPHPVGPRPLGRYGHKISIIATSAMKTKLYLFGGQFDDTYFNDLAVFDLSSFRRENSHWEFIKSKGFIPPPLTNHTMVSYDYQLWVFGGDTQHGLVNDVFRFNSNDNEWSRLETTGSKPPPMQEHSAIVYKNLMCVIGGKDEHDLYLNSVYFLNFDTLIWTHFPVFKSGILQGRSGHSITLMNSDKLLVMGGDKYDYAKPGDIDLHTAETDQGEGTILYTFDLSRLNKICPGIFDSELESTDEINQANKHVVVSDPSTPPVNRNISNLNNDNNVEYNQQATILTPYQGNKVESPIVADISIFSSQTPLTDDIEKSTDSLITDRLTTLDKEVVNQETNEKVQEIYEKKVSPLKMNESLSENVEKIDKSIEKTNTLSSTSLEPSHIDVSDDFIDIAIIANSPTKETIKSGNNTEVLDAVETEVLQKTPLQFSNHDLKEEECTRTVEKTINDSSELYGITPVSRINDKSVFEQLRKQVEEIKHATEDTAREASDHIKELEKENNTLKAELAKPSTIDLELTKVRSDYDILEDRVHQLEELLDAKFLDASHLNDIIREQNSKLESLENNGLLQTKLEELQVKYETVVHENEIMKDKYKESNDNEFTQNIGNYSLKLDQLLGEWKQNRLMKYVPSSRSMDVVKTTD